MLRRIGFLFIVLILILEHAVFGPLRVVVLAALYRPDEKKPCPDSEDDRQEYQKAYGPHYAEVPFCFRLRLSDLILRELPTTKSELAAIAAAATIGWRRPAMATGIARRL